MCKFIRFWYLSHIGKCHSLIMHLQLSSRAQGLMYALKLHLHPDYKFVSSEGFGYSCALHGDGWTVMLQFLKHIYYHT